MLLTMDTIQEIAVESHSSGYWFNFLHFTSHVHWEKNHANQEEPFLYLIYHFVIQTAKYLILFPAPWPEAV